MTHTLCYKRLCAALLALMLAVAGSLAAGAVGAPFVINGCAPRCWL